MKRTATLAVAIGLIVLGVAVAQVTAQPITVTPSDVNVAGGHWFSADTRAPGSGTFVIGPPVPPFGIGSFQLVTWNNPEKVQLFTDLYADTPLASIDGIGYQTYRDPSSIGFVATLPTLNIRVDLDNNGTADAYMVYEPYQDLGNGAVLTGVWQAWDAYRNGAAKWWINTGAGGCGQATPCTWASIMGMFSSAVVKEAASCGPAAAVSPCPGSLGVNQGSFNSGTKANADGLYVSVLGESTTFDFEPYVVAASADQCKKGGWQRVRRADGSPFKNQGACVSYVNTGK